MSKLIAKNEDGAARETVPARGYLALVNRVYDLGTQDSGQYGPRHQVLVSWELHGRKGPARDAAGNVFTITKFYSLSFSEKANLRHDVEAMLGKPVADADARKGVDLETLLGFPCRLQVTHEPRPGGQGVRENVAAIMALDPDDPVPTPATEHRLFEIEPGEPIPPWVPDWVKRFVERSPEWSGQKAGAPTAAGSGGNGAVATSPASPLRRAGVPAPAVTQAEVDDDIPF